jgi:hypothetical protein
MMCKLFLGRATAYHAMLAISVLSASLCVWCVCVPAGRPAGSGTGSGCKAMHAIATPVAVPLAARLG